MSKPRAEVEGYFRPHKQGMLLPEDDPTTWIECCLCGRRLRAMNRHLVAKHGITAAEYRKTYGLPTICEQLSAIRDDILADGERRFARHWSKASIVSALRRASKNGVAPSVEAWRAMDTSPYDPFSGRRRSRPCAETVRLIFGSWTAAIEYAGLQPIGHPNSRKTHCKHGHEFTPENTVHRQGQRFCRECVRRHSREYMRAKRQEMP